MSSTRRRKTSTLGCLSLFAGIVALAATRMPLWGVGPVTLGVLGAAVGLLGLLSAVIIGHAGRLLPVFAIFTCLSAAGDGLAVNGRANGVGERVSALIAQWRSTGPSSVSAGPARAAPGSGVSTGPGSGGASAHPDPGVVGKGTIFDMTVSGSPETRALGAHSSALSPASQSPAPAATPGSGAASLRLRLANAQADVQAAGRKLDAAQEVLQRRLTAVPEYQAAASDLASAEAELSDTRASSAPGSGALIVASRKVLDARTVLEKLINAASIRDPAVTSAHRDLSDARNKLAAIKAEQASATSSKAR